MDNGFMMELPWSVFI